MLEQPGSGWRLLLVPAQAPLGKATAHCGTWGVHGYRGLSNGVLGNNSLGMM